MGVAWWQSCGGELIFLQNHHQHKWNIAFPKPVRSIWHPNEFVGIEDRLFAEPNLPGPDPTEGRGGLIIKLAHYCWDRIFMGDYFHNIRVCVCVFDSFLPMICSNITGWDGRWTEREMDGEKMKLTDLMGWWQQSVLTCWWKGNAPWTRLSVSLHISVNIGALNSKSWLFRFN